MKESVKEKIHKNTLIAIDYSNHKLVATKMADESWHGCRMSQLEDRAIQTWFCMEGIFNISWALTLWSFKVGFHLVFIALVTRISCIFME